MAPTDVQVLIPRNCDDVVVLNGKSYFSEVIKIKNTGLSLWAPCNHKDCYKREARESETERKQGGDKSRGS